MSDTVIEVENISKQYRLGEVGTGTMSHDLNRWWHRIRGKENPYLQVGESNDRTVKGGSQYVWALRDVSFKVKRGEILGIIGRNGAGKSTLLKILSRVTTPTAGTIKAKGRIASLLEVGTGFNPQMTGRENIYLNGAILGMRKHEIDRKFDEIVAFAEVDRFIDTPVKRYSSGMYVRLAFAVSAHLQTDILVVDEVLAVGDVEFQKKCLGKMQEVSTGQGRTVLFVSHQLGAIRRLCNVACLMSRGQTDGIMPVGTALHKYTSEMGESPYDLDLSSVRRTGNMGATAKVTRLVVPSTSTLRFGEPLVLVFQIHCTTPINNLIIGIGFDTLDGYRIMTLDSDNSTAPLRLDAGAHEVRFDVDYNPLHPSTYVCGVSIMSGGHVLDNLSNCATWQVLTSEMDVASSRGFAGCRVPVDVRVKDIVIL